MILPTLGTMGLILIVLEGALELKYERRKLQLILNSFFSSLIILVATSVSIAYVFTLLTGFSFTACFINALPFSIISSAIAIPSSKGLKARQREFVVYESAFSDIIGVIIFNFILYNQEIHVSSFFALTLETLLIIVISLLFCLFLLYIIRKIRHPVKFFLIIAIIVLVYSAGHLLHLPSLLMVLVFGLFFNNAEEIRPLSFKKYFLYDDYRLDLSQFYKLSAESAFLIRTFFFIIFGFIIDIKAFDQWTLIDYTIVVLLIIYFVRFAYLKFIGREKLLPLLFLNPRGLISILLFFSLPEDMAIPNIDSKLLFLVVLSTSLIMSIGLITNGRPKAGEDR